MTSRRIEVSMPLGGISDDRAYSEQPAGTVPDASNVRSLDSPTGRGRISQRSGTKKLVASQVNGSNKVQALASVAYSKPRITHTALTGTDNGETDPGSIAEKWTKAPKGGGPVYSVVTDRQGNVYALDGDSAVVKHNPDGELVTRLSLPVKASDTLCQRIAVDRDDAVYVAATRADGSGRVWRFEPDPDDEEDEYVLSQNYPLDLESGPVELLVEGGFLYLIVEHPTETPKTRLVGYFNLSSYPAAFLEASVPDPVNALKAGPDGSLYLATTFNTSRGAHAAPDAFTYRVLPYPLGPLWTPHDLDNARERLYSWYDASVLASQTGIEDGDEVTNWPSRVSHDTKSGGGPGFYDTVYDGTDRSLSQDSATTGRLGPTYRASKLGGMPCVEFDGSTPTVGGAADTAPFGNALYSGENASGSTGKTLATDPAPNQRAIIPGDIGTSSNEYAIFFVVRFTQQDTINVLFQQAAGENGHLSTGVLLNTEWTTAKAALAGSIHVDCRGRSGGSESAGLNNGGQDSGARLNDGSGINDANSAIIALVHGGASAGAASSQLRVNGVNLDSFQFLADETHGGSLSTVRSILGCRVADDDGTIPAHYDGTTSHKAFDGDLMEILCVLADSSANTSAHDTAVTFPANQPEGGLLGSQMQRVARGNLSWTEEVELLEGYLAHKWGLAHLLPNGYEDPDANGNASNHPWGGTGQFPVSPEWDGEDQTTLQDHWHPDAHVSKLNPLTGEPVAVVRGGGLGFQVEPDDEDGVCAFGPWIDSNTTAFQRHAGPSNLDEEEVSVRKFEDQGTSFKYARAADGWLVLRSQPSDEDYIELGDGSTTVRFEFNSGGGVTGTNTSVTIGADTETTCDNLASAVNGSALALTAYEAGDVGVYFVNDAVGADGNVAIAIGNEAGTAGWGDRLGIDGMDGGVDADEDWTVSFSAVNEEPALAQGQALLHDTGGDFYALMSRGTASTNLTDKHLIRKFDGTDGSTLWDYEVGSSVQGYDLAFPPTLPVYSDEDIKQPEFLYVGSDDGGTDGAATLRKLTLVASTQDLADGSSPREVRYLAVAGGTIARIVRGGSVTTPSGGSGALRSSSPFVSAVTHFGKVYLADGTSTPIKVYDPKADTIEDLVVDGPGEIPSGGKILSSWRGRLVVAHTTDDPQGWFFSKVGEPDNWDLYPAVVTADQAVAGTSNTAGKCPDIITGFIPYNDDLALVGCDSTLYRFTGDPMAGGQFDLVSRAVGMAWEAWTIDPYGRIFFFGSQGGVYVVSPSGVPEPITRDRIQRRMQGVDLTRFRVRLAWNHRDEGLHVFVTPIGSGGFASKHWFWDHKHDAWWEDEFFSTSRQPACVATFDGDDPDDRVLVLGCEDGYVRHFDRTARDDDGERIESRIKLGPLAPKGVPGVVRFSNLRAVLASDQDGCDYEWRVADAPDEDGRLVDSGELVPGRNPQILARARGNVAWLTLRNARPGERWALEGLSLEASPAGRERV